MGTSGGPHKGSPQSQPHHSSVIADADLNTCTHIRTSSLDTGTSKMGQLLLCVCVIFFRVRGIDFLRFFCNVEPFCNFSFCVYSLFDSSWSKASWEKSNSDHHDLTDQRSVIETFDPSWIIFSPQNYLSTPIPKWNQQKYREKRHFGSSIVLTKPDPM